MRRMCRSFAFKLLNYRARVRNFPRICGYLTRAAISIEKLLDVELSVAPDFPAVALIFKPRSCSQSGQVMRIFPVTERAVNPEELRNTCLSHFFVAPTALKGPRRC